MRPVTKKKLKAGPTAHGAIAPAKLMLSREWPYAAVILPGTCDDGCHYYNAKDVRALADWLLKAAEIMEKENNA